MRCGAALAQAAALSAPATARLAQPVERARERGRIELSVAVLAEGGHGRHFEQLRPHCRRTALPGLEAPDPAVAEVAEDVAAPRRRHGRAAVDVAARDRARTAVVRVDPGREDELARAPERIGAVEDGAPLVAVPAVVGQPADLRLRAEVDLLPGALADVGDPEVAGRPVEREPPRVAEPVADRLPRGPARQRIDPQQLTEPR